MALGAYTQRKRIVSVFFNFYEPYTLIKMKSYDWVRNEYMRMFQEMYPGKMPMHFKETEKRMREFCTENPRVTKDDVLDATRLYLRSVNPKFIRLPHYFIKKKIDGLWISDLAAWLNAYYRTKAQAAKRNITNKLQ